MTSPGPTPQPFALPTALAQLRAGGALTLPGRCADVTLRWMRRRAWFSGFGFGTLAIGVILMVLGGVLRDTGSCALALVVGCFLTFCGAVWVGAVFLLRALYARRLSAESRPVTIDSAGVVLRGIGPIPWSDVAPPERRSDSVRARVCPTSGRCAVVG